MGLNWSRALEGAAEGVAVMGAHQARREDQEIEQLRQENFARLTAGLAMERDRANNADIDKRQKDRDAAIEDRQDRRDAAMFGRQQKLIESQEAREDMRNARAMELDERRSMRERLADAKARAGELRKQEADALAELEALETSTIADPKVIARRRRQLEEIVGDRQLAERDIVRFQQRGMPTPPRRGQPFAPSKDPFEFGPQLIPTQPGR